MDRLELVQRIDQAPGDDTLEVWFREDDGTIHLIGAVETTSDGRLILRGVTE